MTEHLPGVLGSLEEQDIEDKERRDVRMAYRCWSSWSNNGVYQEMVQEPSVVLYTSLDVLAGLQ